tara:strand:- start:648 stop:1607 length:960 start_codon:yes stop_codon:yes gene_type:complete
MTIKTKTRDPKLNEFANDEVIINIKEGSLFYKSRLGLHKLKPAVIVTATAVAEPLPEPEPVDTVCSTIENDSLCDPSKNTITLNTELGDSSDFGGGTPSTFVLSSGTDNYQNDSSGDNSETVTLGLSTKIGDLDDDDPYHRVLKIENKAGFVEIGPVGYGQVFGNGDHVPGAIFRTNKTSFSFASNAASSGGEINLLVKGGSRSGYRSLTDDLWLSTSAGNLDVIDIQDRAHIQLKSNEASTTIYGDVNIQANTADADNNIGTGNLNVDGRINTSQAIEAPEGIVITDNNGDRFRVKIQTFSFGPQAGAPQLVLEPNPD